MFFGAPISDLARRAARAAVVACAVLALGCSQTRSVQRMPRGEMAGNQGGAWEVLLSTAEAPIHADWEYARLDEAMNIRATEPDAPYWDDVRRIYLNPRADQVIYFRRRPLRQY